jgi:uncharacterized membrane protein
MVKKETKKKEEKTEEKRKTPKSPFILALIGGILYLILGLILFQSYHFVSIQMTTNPEMFNLIAQQQNLTATDMAQVAQYFSSLSWIALIIFLIAGIVSLVGAFLMRKDKTMKSGGILSLIIGILSINILTIIAGALGISFASKKK